MRSFQRAVIPVRHEALLQSKEHLKKLVRIVQWLGCELNLYLIGQDSGSLEDQVVGELAGTASPHGILLHRATVESFQAFQSWLEQTKIDLILLSIRKGGSEVLEQFHREILRLSPIPALLVPENIQGDGVPESLLVPFSPEGTQSPAMEFALRLANEKALPLDLIHVSQQDHSCSCEDLVLEKYGDQFHYEYPKLLEQLIVQAVPFSTQAERTKLRSFKHFQGQVEQQILSALVENPNSWLFFDWKGSFEPGRAKIIKHELQRIRCPILLVHAAKMGRFQLKIGEDFEAA